MLENPITRPIVELSADLRLGKLTSLDLLENALDRIATLDRRLESFLCPPRMPATRLRRQIANRSGSVARTSARRPVAVKDNYLTEDMPSHAGTDAPGVQFARQELRSRRESCAKPARSSSAARMHRIRVGDVHAAVEEPLGSQPRPWRLEQGDRRCRRRRGSCQWLWVRTLAESISASSAALCGTVGLKPTFGRVSRAGIVPHSWSLDHAGPLSYTVADSVYALNAISGHDPKDPGSARTDVPDFTAALGQPITDLRVGICRNHMFGNNQPTSMRPSRTRFAFYRNVGVRSLNSSCRSLLLVLERSLRLSSPPLPPHSHNLASGAVTGFTDDVRTLVEMGRLVTGPDYLKADSSACADR